MKWWAVPELEIGLPSRGGPPAAPTGPPPVECQSDRPEQPSWAWWLLPTLLGSVGGLLAWLFTRRRSQAWMFLLVGNLVTLSLFFWVFVGPPGNAARQWAEMEKLARAYHVQIQLSREALGITPWDGRWENLWPFEKAALEVMPEARAIREKAGGSAEFQQGRQIIYDYYDRQVARDDALDALQLPNGTVYTPDDWKRDYYEAQGQLAVARETFDQVSGITYRDPKTPNEKARAGYYDLMEKFLDKDTNTFDGDGWEMAKKKYLDGLPEEQRKYVVLNTGLYDTPKVKEFKADKAKMQPYWDIRDRFMKKRVSGNGTVQDILEKWVKISNRGEPGDRRRADDLLAIPEVAIAISDIKQERIRFRLSPEGAEPENLLIKWGYLSEPINPLNVRRMYIGASR